MVPSALSLKAMLLLWKRLACSAYVCVCVHVFSKQHKLGPCY